MGIIPLKRFGIHYQEQKFAFVSYYLLQLRRMKAFYAVLTKELQVDVFKLGSL